MDDGAGLFMQVHEAGQDGLAPALDHSQLRDFVLLDIAA